MEYAKGSTGGDALKSFCDHCGNITIQNILALEVVSSGNQAVTFTFSKCTICQGIVLRRHPFDWNAPVRLGEGKPSPRPSFEQLWPPAMSFSSDVPERVRIIYDEARRIRQQSPSSFVVQLRRALEVVAKDKGAQGKTLNAQIEWLIQQGQLPQVFAEMIHIARMIGNLGAHDADRDVTTQDAKISDQFFRAVIEYLYVAPALLAQVRASPTS